MSLNAGLTTIHEDDIAKHQAAAQSLVTKLRLPPCGSSFCLVSFIVKKAGTGWLDVMFPPAAMGAIVAVIGLELAGVAANMAGLLPADGAPVDSTAPSTWVRLTPVGLISTRVIAR